MKKLVVLMLIALSVHAETIRVLVADQVEEAMLEVTGPYQLLNPENEKYVGSGTFGKAYPVQPGDVGMRWGEEFVGLYQVTLVPIPTLSHSSVLVDGVRYPGVIHVYQVGGTLSVVNEIEVDDYLCATLAREFPHALPPEAMAALAIAARTTAKYDIERREKAFWHVRAEEVNYSGYVPSQATAAVEQAINETRGMILDGEAFPALWTENCAGATAPFHLMFRKSFAEDLPSVTSRVALRDRQSSSWRLAVPKEWLANIAEMSSVSGVTLYTDPDSHKVYGVRIVHDGKGKDVDFFTLQEAIGADRLRSSDFTVELEGDQVIFSGYGVGHGVGICLHSAEKMAKEGKNAADILHHFFPQHHVNLLSQSDKPSRLQNLARGYARRRR